MTQERSEQESRVRLHPAQTQQRRRRGRSTAFRSRQTRTLLTPKERTCPCGASADAFNVATHLKLLSAGWRRFYFCFLLKRNKPGKCLRARLRVCGNTWVPQLGTGGIRNFCPHLLVEVWSCFHAWKGWLLKLRECVRGRVVLIKNQFCLKIRSQISPQAHLGWFLDYKHLWLNWPHHFLLHLI